MVPKNDGSVETTAYLGAVAGFAVLLLVVLLFLNRRWCYSAVFGRKCCDDILTVNVRVPDDVDHAQFDALKVNHFPKRIYAFETSDSDDELRLRIQQAEDVECQYEEKNENQTTTTPPTQVRDVKLIETALRETTLRETRIDDVVSKKAAAAYIHTLEAQSSIESDGITAVDTMLLCGESGSGSQPRGSLEVTLLYDAPVRSMTVHVLQAKGLPARNETTVLQSQVRVVLLPMKKQKYKSKIRYGENPQYMESFVFHKINPEDVHGLGLRVRVYGCERMRRQRLLGEASVAFASLTLEVENGLWLQLAPRHHHQHAPLPKVDAVVKIAAGVPLSQSLGLTGLGGGLSGLSGRMSGLSGGLAGLGSPGSGSLARSDSASSCCSARAAPELLLGLQYNPPTGHLCVEIIKGTQFRKLSTGSGGSVGGNAGAAPDTYVKLCLVGALGREMARCKSTTRRALSNPLYKELFIFQVALFQLSEVTLMVSVWCRRSVKRNEMVGWFSIGLNSSGREESRHWKDLCENHGEQIQRWHVLLDS